MEPTFDVPIVNVTVVRGQIALLPCSIDFLGKYKVLRSLLLVSLHVSIYSLFLQCFPQCGAYQLRDFKGQVMQMQCQINLFPHYKMPAASDFQQTLVQGEQCYDRKAEILKEARERLTIKRLNACNCRRADITPGQNPLGQNPFCQGRLEHHLGHNPPSLV